MLSQKAKFANKVAQLKRFRHDNNGDYPSASAGRTAQEQKLAKWIQKQRALHNTKSKVLNDERIAQLKEVDPKVFEAPKRGRRPLNENSWASIVRSTPAKKKEVDMFVDHRGRPYITEHKSVKEYVYNLLDAPELSPEECTFDSQFGSLQRNMAYLRLGIPEWISGRPKLQPSWMNDRCRSICFSSQSGIYDDVESTTLLENAYASIFSRRFNRNLKAAETKEGAARVIDQEAVFDDCWYGKEGRHWTNLVRLNASTLPQSRRVTMSVPVSDVYKVVGPHDNTVEVQDLYAYGSEGRPTADWRCQQITSELSLLSEYIWTRVWPHLTPVSQTCPPNAVQVLLYNSTLGSKIGMHKDNGLRNDKLEQGRMGTSPKLNSQMLGSNVITATWGDAMDFYFATPPDGEDYTAEQKVHKQDKELTISLDHKSVFILDPNDDENYMHAAKFPTYSGNGKVRVAFVFRWLSRRKPFYSNTEGALKNAMYVPGAKETLLKNKKKTGPKWVKALGLDDNDSDT